MPQMAFKKYRRSSFLAKPASCDTLFNRTSTIRRIAGPLRRAKNSSADFFVNPMVNSFIAGLCYSSLPETNRLALAARGLLLLLGWTRGAGLSAQCCEELVSGKGIDHVGGFEPSPAGHRYPVPQERQMHRIV